MDDQDYHLEQFKTMITSLKPHDLEVLEFKFKNDFSYYGREKYKIIRTHLGNTNMEVE